MVYLRHLVALYPSLVVRCVVCNLRPARKRAALMRQTLGALQCALAGAGIARFPYHVVKPDIESGRLVSLLRDFERQEASVYAVYPAQRELALKTRAFIDFIVAEIGSIRNV